MDDGLRIPIGADSTLRRDLQSAEQEITNFVNKINKIGEAGQQIASLGKSLTTSITLPILGLGAAAVKSYADIQSLQKGLEAVMGSANGASREFDKLKEVAKLPGLGLKEAAQGSVALQSAGFSANQARKSLMAFGNALATVGKGANEMNMVILALTQLQNKTSGYGQDLRQLTEQLPQLRGALTAAFGTSDSEAISKSGKTGAEVVKMLTKEFEKLPKVTGGIKNAFENLGDAMQTSLARIGKIIDKNIDVSGLIDRITGFVDKIVTAFENLDPAFQTAILGVAAFAAAIGPLLVVVGSFMALLPTLTAGVGALSVAFTAMTGPIGLVVIGIGAIIAAVVTNWDKIEPYFSGTVEWFKRMYVESNIFRLSVQGIGFSFNALGMIAVEVAKNIWQNFKTIGKGLLEMFAGLGGVIEGTLTLDWQKVKEGYKRGFSAVANTVTGLAKNGLNTFDSILSNMDNLEKKWTGLSFDNISESAKKVVENFAEVEKKTNSITKGFAKGTEGWYEEEIKRLEELKNSAIVGSKAWNDLNVLIEKYQKLLNPDKIKPIEIEPIEIKGGSKDLSYLGKIFGTPAEIEVYINSLIAGIETLPNRLQTTFDEVRAGFQSLTAQLNADLKNLITTSISSGIYDMATGIGEALATGKDLISTIGNGLLGMFSSFISNMGKLLIEYGTLAIMKGTLDEIVKTGGYQAVAAGLAAIAVGAALSVAGGALGSAAKGGMNGSSASTATGSSGVNSYSSNFTSGGSSDGEVRFRISGTDLISVLEVNNYKASRLNAG